MALSRNDIGKIYHLNTKPKCAKIGSITHSAPTELDANSFILKDLNTRKKMHSNANSS